MQQIVFVISMHRSGSSLLTKGLECCGITLGNHLMPRSRDNPKGFFEDQRISELNEYILNIMDHQWSLLNADSTKLQTNELKIVENKIEDLIFKKLNECGDDRSIGIKDPRFCRLAHLWFSICKKHSIPYKVIFLVRDPNEVARSLNIRNNIPLIGGYALWLDYMSSALEQLTEVETLFIRLDAFYIDIDKHINSISHFLDTKIDTQILHHYVNFFYQKHLIHEIENNNELISSPSWDYLKNCQSGSQFSTTALTELKEIYAIEKQSKISLKGYIAQLSWHRVAENEVLRNRIYAQENKIKRLQQQIKNDLLT